MSCLLLSLCVAFMLPSSMKAQQSEAIDSLDRPNIVVFIADDLGMEDIAPYALGRPALEAVVECLPRAIRRWRIDPTTAALDDMDDTADDPTVVHPRLASNIGRQQRLDDGPLLVGQVEPRHRSTRSIAIYDDDGISECYRSR